MAIQINYDDDIYLLQTMIKTLNAAVQLKVDSDLFTEKITDDLFFIDATIQGLYRRLGESRKLLRRAEHLRSILRAKSALIDTIEICLKPETSMHEALTAFHGRLRACRNEHGDDIADIRTILQYGDDDEDVDEDLVSQEEFLSLLQQDDDEDEQTD